ncbi:uncharacterized protein [Lepisosteus oculatus]|uniref:uncharacterized protein isoform X3 n=1 Tax=Lepisosteus oculatus TaxID=7918 RepID=UPI0037117F74
MRAPTLLLSFWLYAETAVSTARTSVLTAHPGGEITLVCSLNKSCFRVSWWKVQPNGIRPLAPVLASSRIAPKTTLDKKCALWISAVQEYDAATYYCAENWNPGQLGNGFTVAIGEQEQSTVEEQLTRPKSDKGYKKNTTSSVSSVQYDCGSQWGRGSDLFFGAGHYNAGNRTVPVSQENKSRTGKGFSQC